MLASVIICGYSMNRLKDIIAAVESIYNQTYRNIEVIVSIDHNKELLLKLKEMLPGKVIFAFNDLKPGLSETRNAGIRKAKGDIIAFIDDDAVADSKWLENLIINYKDPSIVAVGGKLVPLWEKGRPWWFPEEFDWIVGCTYKGFPEKRGEVRNLIGCNMSFRKSVFEKVGYFSDRLGRLGNNALAGEETELCLKIKASIPEGKIIYEPEALVYHKVPVSRCRLNYVIKRAYGEGLSKGCFPNKSLTTENSYLRFLLTTSMIGYIKDFFLLKSPLQNIGKLSLTMSAIIATGIGYVKGKLYLLD
ncbi:glycosyltransferase family 2 protein [Moorella sp. ACPs]|uniref:glycosyltransferase family 2 protein n=1 Tax=Neomoorella carbonis TaxID=3062783 RepID=UPI00324974DA